MSKYFVFGRDASGNEIQLPFFYDNITKQWGMNLPNNRDPNCTFELGNIHTTSQDTRIGIGNERDDGSRAALTLSTNNHVTLMMGHALTQPLGNNFAIGMQGGGLPFVISPGAVWPGGPLNYPGMPYVMHMYDYRALDAIYRIP